MSITLYGYSGSTYVRTVRMLLAEKGADYEQVPVDVLQGEPHSPEHLLRHPFGKVPVIDHDGFRVIESGAITAYLNEVLPGPSLMPETARDRARANMAIGIYDSYGYGALVSVAGYHLFPDFIGGQNEESRRNGIENSRRVLRELMKIKGQDHFIAGPNVSLADFYLVPFCTYIALTPDAAQVFDVEGFAQWWQQVQALPSFKATLP
ncbi:glutathione S-transferase family protein [Pseudomonas gingeri]|uniref:glutathione S-transferase family protein n=1 Tax=Pseudomonas gingeri TaxID=117681 RepID=UPI0015A3A3D5|nr:glutathione S-transferase family protein [Pseudomonas gingeri]NVZ61946.1 glutathione S-transferase family protein [Pseudomonas gingeri]NVZ73946.1 glutathione S-transferase family protein [Pseudomonas gingeri]